MVEGHPNIKMANSLIDYVFRALGMEYLGRTDLVQVPPKEVGELPEPPTGLAVDAGVQLGMDDDLPIATHGTHQPPRSSTTTGEQREWKRKRSRGDDSGCISCDEHEARDRDDVTDRIGERSTLRHDG